MGGCGCWSLLLGRNPSRAERKAAALLADWCSGLGARCRVQWGGELPEGPSYAFVIGTPEGNPAVSALARTAGIELTDEQYNRDGFLVGAFPPPSGGLWVLVASPSSFGVVCAADELKRRARRMEDLPRLHIAERPAFAGREYHMVLPKDDEFLIERRINTVSLPGWYIPGTGFPGIYIGMKLMESLLGRRWERTSWLNLDHTTLTEGEFWEEFLEKADEWYAQYRKRMGEVRGLGVEVLLTRYEFAYPFPDLFHRYFPKECLEHSKFYGPIPCPSKPMVRRIFREYYHLAFQLFPELSGVYVFLSGEGGVRGCTCPDCEEDYRRFLGQFPYYRRWEDRKDSYGLSLLQRLRTHNRFFELIYDAVREARPDAVIVRNAWEFNPCGGNWLTQLALDTIPEDVILRVYTVSEDTNLQEPPNPQITEWARAGRKVSPKQCQLLEMHPRTQCFPNYLADRMRRFYQQWAEEGVYGTVVHGGWWPTETLETYLELERNIGTGFNYWVHWKLMWDPFREDLEELFDEWARTVYGEEAKDLAKRCIKRAGQVYLIDPPIEPIASYEDPRKKAKEFVLSFHYILLSNKYPFHYLGRPDRFEDALSEVRELFPGFWKRMAEVQGLLGENLRELAGTTDPKLKRLSEWFRVESEYVKGMEALFKAEELYLFEKDPEAARPYYLKAERILMEALRKWGAIALREKIWPFFIGGHFDPRFAGKPVDPEGKWLDTGYFGVFFRWLRSRIEGRDFSTPPLEELWDVEAFEEMLHKFETEGPLR
ncbi:MAG: hypothetical protein DRQ08_05035 [Candidatus Latescibacterota bacterium]|nr:MAG: hypothetical protein DRQ08_05035 [Candidatus Latescibacterota bacterium]